MTKVSASEFPIIYESFRTVAHDCGAVNRLEPFPDAFDVSPDFDLLTIESKLGSMSASFIEDLLLGDGDELDECVKHDPDLVPLLNLIDRFYTAYVEEEYEGATITHD